MDTKTATDEQVKLLKKLHTRLGEDFDSDGWAKASRSDASEAISERIAAVDDIATHSVPLIDQVFATQRRYNDEEVTWAQCADACSGKSVSEVQAMIAETHERADSLLREAGLKEEDMASEKQVDFIESLEKSAPHAVEALGEFVKEGMTKVMADLRIKQLRWGGAFVSRTRSRAPAPAR